MQYDDVACRPLLITPAPQCGESYMGFILRTAEENGYLSIQQMLRHAGMSNSEIRSARPPLHKLARLFQWPEAAFSGLGHAQSDKGRMLGLGPYLLPARHLLRRRAWLCMDCIRERGCIDAFWELRHAVACPFHRRMTLSGCPECHHPLDWLRSGLTRCKCGYDLDLDLGKTVDDPAMIALMALLHAKFAQQPVDADALRAAGFPLAALEGVSLQTLLDVLYRLENIPAPDNGSAAEVSATEMAAAILQRWPDGLQESLTKSDHWRQGISLRGAFLSLYECMFKHRSASGEVAFMHDAMVQFSRRYGIRVGIDAIPEQGRLAFAED